MNTKNEPLYDLNGGPVLNRLIDSLKYAYDRAVDYKVVFTTTKGILIEAKIIGLEHEDGSGHSFNLKAYIQSQENYLLVRIYYNSNKKTGSIWNI